jgi:carbonic anhydrase/acetyltransferase-like protein (isoleucine patch superfamily)
MSLVLFDNNERDKLYPLNKICAVADLRTGIFTARDRWERISQEKVFIHTADYLSVLYEPVPQSSHIWIDANLIPDEYLINRILSLAENEALVDAKGLVAGRKKFEHGFSSLASIADFEKILKTEDVRRIEYAWNIFQYNNEMLREDFARLTAGRISQPLPKTSQFIEPENIFIEEGAVINFSIVNAATGPVYIGKNSTIMEGCTIRGPVALCEGSTLKMGAKIYGATTLGPY